MLNLQLGNHELVLTMGEAVLTCLMVIILMEATLQGCLLLGSLPFFSYYFNFVIVTCNKKLSLLLLLYNYYSQ